MGKCDVISFDGDPSAGTPRSGRGSRGGGGVFRGGLHLQHGSLDCDKSQSG
jgi:hypothetical protein